MEKPRWEKENKWKITFSGKNTIRKSHSYKEPVENSRFGNGHYWKTLVHGRVPQWNFPTPAENYIVEQDLTQAGSKKHFSFLEDFGPCTCTSALWSGI
jgi:hypothetical protein